MSRVLLSLIAVLLWIPASTSDASDWSRFRGPNGSGISADAVPAPTKWSPKENLQWKAQLPGPGVSSPIVVGDRVFVTCYSGYGVDRANVGEMKDLKRHLVCFDVNSGDQIWDRSVKATLPEDPYDGIGVTAHGYASHTPVSDGERIYVFFGKTGALAFDLDGNQLWQQGVGTESDPWQWGSASSPVLYGDLLIVTASAESQSLVGLNTKTGKEVWRQPAAGLDGVWGTPALVEIDGERTDLVLAVPNEIWGFNPETGKLRWYCDGGQSEQSQSSVVVGGNEIFALAGRGGGSIAVRAGGKGDVTDSHISWTGSDSARFGTPVHYEGRLFVAAGDMIIGIDAKTGRKSFQTRLEGGTPSGGGRGGFGGQRGSGGGGRGREGGRGGIGGGRGGPGGGFGSQDYASLIIADGKLYYVRGSGDTFVLEIGDKLKQLAVNKVTDETESFGGTPAVSNGRLFIRSNKHLYCVADGS